MEYKYMACFLKKIYVWKSWNMAMRAAVSGLEVCVCDSLNKAGMCGRSALIMTSQANLFLPFTTKKGAPCELKP